MRKTLFHGNNRAKPAKRDIRDDGTILGFTVFLLFCVVSAIGLLLNASYAEYRKVCSEYETFVASQEISGDSSQEIQTR